MKWIAGICLVVAVAAGALAFQQHQAAEAAQAQAAALKAEAQKAQADATAARTELDAARKEATELALTVQQLRSAADVASQFLEAEKAVSARLRQDLAMASARLAAANARPQRGSDTIRPSAIPPTIMLHQPPPPAVRAAPGGPTSFGAPAPAR